MQEQIAQKDLKIQEIKAEAEAREKQISGLIESLKCLK